MRVAKKLWEEKKSFRVRNKIGAVKKKILSRSSGANQISTHSSQFGVWECSFQARESRS